MVGRAGKSEIVDGKLSVQVIMVGTSLRAAPMTSTTAVHLPYLDGWRGLAILFLLIGHFFPVAGINLGALGVNLFFVLSGFLMARILFIETAPLPIFYKRRIARIVPSVLVFIGLIVIGYLALGKNVSWRETAAATLFVSNYFPGEPGNALMPFGHIWSLCVEEHSYILLSLAALLVRAGLCSARVAVGALAAACAASALVHWFSYTGEHLVFDRWIHTEVAAFGIFISAFMLLCLHGRDLARVPLFLLALLAIGGVTLQWWSVPLPVGTIVGVGALALLLNLLRTAPAWVHTALAWAPMRQLGVWSFSIYLWQQPFYRYIGPGAMHPALGAGLALITGIAAFYLLERPARAYLNRNWGRKPVLPAMQQA
jgi:peptidoglycan/LPS O-acetylase OafA/YrhL